MFSSDLVLVAILFSVGFQVVSSLLQCYLFSVSPGVVPIGISYQNVTVTVECNTKDTSAVSSTILSNAFAVVSLPIYIYVCVCVWRHPLCNYSTASASICTCTMFNRNTNIFRLSEGQLVGFNKNCGQ